ncbi:MAG: cyclopropane-fatty-acyl-phospholipid synthase [Solirubrobacterales bacterium]|jgi:cyclopropane-fatty-acyl-phospholipid synthase|nr:cyclopropane-fatty-acyl-phospholipid synthase [Solirubrobacterales bacterium]
MTERRLDTLARRAGHAMLRNITDGCLEVTENGRTTAFGSPSSALRARVEILDPKAWTTLMRGSNGLAQGYIDRLWTTDDPVGVVRVAARRMGPLDRMRNRWHPLVGRVEKLTRLVPRNTKEGARYNISAHYDLGNDLFASFLDERLMYSSAYYPSPDTSLEDAQTEKLDRLCRQLKLEPDDHLVEIGTGWGGLAIYAASEYGCRVTTTTISKEQRAYALEWVAEEGLEDQITVLDQDYRDLQGKFSKLVSIEMIEAVGWQYFKTFFRKCSGLLADDGLMALQAIVIDNDLYEVEKASKSFANTVVFPGGCLPSERVIDELVTHETDMSVRWVDDITPHYSETLREWRQRFEAAWPRLRGSHYDERFRRMWTFYLAFSEGGFRERRIRDLQMVFAKPGFAPPAWREPALASITA